MLTCKLSARLPHALVGTKQRRRLGEGGLCVCFFCNGGDVAATPDRWGGGLPGVTGIHVELSVFRGVWAGALTAVCLFVPWLPPGSFRGDLYPLGGPW